MPSTFFKKIEVKGLKLEVSVNDNGEFVASLDGELVNAPSLDGLKKKISVRLAKQSRVSIPFVTWENEALRRGTITGIHASNNNILVTWEDGTHDQVYRWGRCGFFLPEYESALEKLGTAFESANKAFNAFTRENKFNPTDKVREVLGVKEEEDED